MYDKTLRLSSWSLTEGGMTPGQVMNHMAVDSMHLFMLFYLLHFTWTLPIQVSVNDWCIPTPYTVGTGLPKIFKGFKLQTMNQSYDWYIILCRIKIHDISCYNVTLYNFNILTCLV